MTFVNCFKIFTSRAADIAPYTFMRRAAPLVYYVIPAIYIQSFAGDKTSGVVRQKGRSYTDVFDADKTAGRSLDLGFFEKLVEFRDAGSGTRGKRAGRNGMNPYPL